MNNLRYKKALRRTIKERFSLKTKMILLFLLKNKKQKT
jgi:hypothetical protein